MKCEIPILMDEVLQRIYARTAIDAYANSPSKEIAMMHDDHREALELMVGDMFSELVLRLMPMVKSCRLPGDDGSSDMSIELKGSENLGDEFADVVRDNAMSYIVMKVLSMVYADVSRECAAYCGRRAEAILATLQLALDVTLADALPRIVPYK